MRAIVRAAVRRVLMLAALWSLFVNQLGAVTEGGVLNAPMIPNTSNMPTELMPTDFVPSETEQSGSCPASESAAVWNRQADDCGIGGD